MIRRFCCRCAERLAESDPERSAFKTMRGPLKPMRPCVDLCQPCAADFNKFLSDFPRPEQANGKATTDKAGPRGRMPIPPQFRGA